jgi:acyl-homoserine lactone synthase
MIKVLQGYTLDDPHTAAMFEDRKRLFVDLLSWDVPVIDERFEIDGYDGDDAIYLVADDGDGGHLGSMRLLPTCRPHILGALFPTLCDEGVPTGEAIFEITRLCLPARLGAARRLAIRNRLISAMIDHATALGIVALTGVVSADFREQVLAMGWRCAALGPDTIVGGQRLGAFRIDLDEETWGLLALNGIYTTGAIADSYLREAA